MADAQSVVELVFKGRDETGAATRAALDNAEKFSKTVQNVAAPIAEATLAAIKFEAAILGAGAAITVFAIKTAGDYDTALRELLTVFNIPEDLIGEFSDSILKYAQTSTQSIDQIMKALYAAGSAGVEYSKSLDFLSESEKLSVAGRADLESTTKALISTLNAYGVGTDQAQRFSDAFFQTVKEGQITIPQLAENLSKVTGVAATLGVPIEEIGAAIATLTAQGVPASESMSQIGAILSALIKPTQQAQQVAAELGIEFGAQAIKAKGLEGVLQEVFEATGGNEEQMGKLFGRVEALKAVFFLTGESAGLFSEKLESLQNSAGATDAAYEKMIGSIDTSNQQLANSLKTLLIQIGQPLLDEYGSITSAIAAVFNALGANVKSGNLGGLVQYIETVMADIARAFDTLAKNLPGALEKADLSGFQRNIEAVLEGVKKLFSGVDISTEEGLKTLIEGVGAGFARLGEFVGSALGTLGPMFDALLKIGETIVGLDEKWFKLGGTVGAYAILINSVLGPAVDALIVLLAAKALGLGKVATSASALLPILGQAGLVGAAGAAGYAVGTVLADGIDWVIGKLTGGSSLGSTIYDLVNGTEDWTAATGTAAVALRSVATETQESARQASIYAAEIARLESEYGRIADGALAFYDSVDAALEAATDGQRVFFNDTFGLWVAAAAGPEVYAGAVDGISQTTQGLDSTLADFYRSQGLEWDAVTGKVKTFGDSIDAAAESTGEAAGEASRWHMELVNGIPTFTQVGAAASAGFNESKKAAEEAFRASETYLLKMEEIASNERIALIEAKVTLNVAQIEADTRRIEAAFESLNVGIQSTGELIGTLVGLWADAEKGRERWDLEALIEREYKFREQEFALQKQLTESVIELNYARADSLARGEALITVDGAGLQPHLEAFMWEILRSIQTRVNQDGLEMLLGTA